MSTTLWHIPLSHYNEKARWALDYKGVPHLRKAPPTGFYGPWALWLTRGRQRRLPVLDLDGTVVPDSTAIIAALEERWPEPPLYPDDPADRQRALELEDYFDEQLAPAIRVFGWQHILAQPGGFANALVPDASDKVKRRLNVAMRPAAGVVLRHDYGIHADAAEQARRTILAAMDRVEAELGDGEYLVGDRFGVADLTAASLFTPVMRPEGRPHLPAGDQPAEVAAFAAELDARPGGRWVHEMYRRHRGAYAGAPA